MKPLIILYDMNRIESKTMRTVGEFLTRHGFEAALVRVDMYDSSDMFRIYDLCNLSVAELKDLKAMIVEKTKEAEASQ